MSWLLWRSSLRYLLHHPWQIGLSFLGVALGVAAVVAIDVANRSAERAFSLSTDTIVGRATHQIVGGPSGLAEEVYRILRRETQIRPAAPIVEGDVGVPEYPGRTFHLLGVDPFADGPFRPYLGGIDQTAQNGFVPFLTQPATGLLSSETGRQLGIQLNDEVVIRVGGKRHAVTIVALLQPEDELSQRALENLLVTDIATAQELLGMHGFLSRVDLILPGGEPGETTLAELRTRLGPGAVVLSSQSRSQAVVQMARAFSLNLTALSLLALLVGMFLIYNTMTFAVVQRRQWIGMLRVLGVTQREIFALVLSEAALIGVLGTAAGLLLGIILAQGLVTLVTRTITDLYFVLSVSELTISAWELLKGAGLGLGATVVAALLPAREATTAPPRAILNRSSLEAQSRRGVPRTAIVGACLLVCGGGVLLVPSRDLLLSFIGLFMILLGCVLLTPAATVALLRGVQILVGDRAGILGRVWVRGVVASLSRTAVAVAALMVAVAVTVGVGIMIESFRQTVVHWLGSALHADVYVSPPSLVSRGSTATLDPSLVERFSASPGVAVANTYRGVVVESASGRVPVVGLGLDPRSYPAFRFVEGEPSVVWPVFQHDPAVIVSESYAYHQSLELGASVELRTDRGPTRFPVVGVFADYGSDQGIVMMSRRTYEQFWNDRGVSSLGLYATPGSDIPALIASLRTLAGSEEVFIQANRELRDGSIEIFDRTFTITSVLHLLTIAVAFFGVFSALMALQLERERELGVLRATGLTPRQVWGLVTSQTGLMGVVAGVLALPVGLLLAVVLVFVINRRSFGWTLQLAITPDVFWQALLLAVMAALLAGLYPAFKMARTSPAVALREE